MGREVAIDQQFSGRPRKKVSRGQNKLSDAEDLIQRYSGVDRARRDNFVRVVNRQKYPTKLQTELGARRQRQACRSSF